MDRKEGIRCLERERHLTANTFNGAGKWTVYTWSEQTFLTLTRGGHTTVLSKEKGDIPPTHTPISLKRNKMLQYQLNKTSKSSSHRQVFLVSSQFQKSLWGVGERVWLCLGFFLWGEESSNNEQPGRAWYSNAGVVITNNWRSQAVFSGPQRRSKSMDGANLCLLDWVTGTRRRWRVVSHGGLFAEDSGQTSARDVRHTHWKPPPPGARATGEARTGEWDGGREGRKEAGGKIPRCASLEGKPAGWTATQSGSQSRHWDSLFSPPHFPQAPTSRSEHSVKCGDVRPWEQQNVSQDTKHPHFTADAATVSWAGQLVISWRPHDLTCYCCYYYKLQFLSPHTANAWRCGFGFASWQDRVKSHGVCNKQSAERERS